MGDSTKKSTFVFFATLIVIISVIIISIIIAIMVQNKRTKDKINSDILDPAYKVALDNGFDGTYEKWLRLINKDQSSIITIEKIEEKDNLVKYAIIYNDGEEFFFTVENGKNGKDGTTGEKGEKGENGLDGITPTISISDDGYWVINGVKTSFLSNINFI